MYCSIGLVWLEASGSVNGSNYIHGATLNLVEQAVVFDEELTYKRVVVFRNNAPTL